MTALKPLLFWVLAETPLDEWTQSPEELKTVESVWQSLEENDSLNRDIYAFVSHLSSAPALAHVEKTFLTVNSNNALLKNGEIRSVVPIKSLRSPSSITHLRQGTARFISQSGYAAAPVL